MERVLRDSEERSLHWFTFMERRKKMRRIIGETCDRARVNVEELRRGSRRGNIPQVRSTIAEQLVREFGIPMAEVARELEVSTSTLSKMK